MAYGVRISDWSADVCSSDLGNHADADGQRHWLWRQSQQLGVFHLGGALVRLERCKSIGTSDAFSADERRQMDQQRMIGKRGRRPIGVTSLSFVCIATLIGMPAFALDARSNFAKIGSSRSPGATGDQQFFHPPLEVPE